MPRGKNKPDHQARHYKRRYGIGLDAFLTLKSNQDYRCAICRVSFDDEAPHLDHDHETGAIRGLLCRKCNLGLGHFGDNAETISRALEYLKRSRTSTR